MKSYVWILIVWAVIVFSFFYWYFVHRQRPESSEVRDEQEVQERNNEEQDRLHAPVALSWHSVANYYNPLEHINIERSMHQVQYTRLNYREPNNTQPIVVIYENNIDNLNHFEQPVYHHNDNNNNNSNTITTNNNNTNSSDNNEVVLPGIVLESALTIQSTAQVLTPSTPIWEREEQHDQ